jgi:hypothetical protein
LDAPIDLFFLSWNEFTEKMLLYHQLFGKWAALDFDPVLSDHEFLWRQVEHLA